MQRCEIEPVPAVETDLASAYAACCERVEPGFVAAELFVDDRGWSIMNQMQGILKPCGQINYSVMHPGVVKAWHRHHRQTDFWLCVLGRMQVGVHRDGGRTWRTVLDPRRPGVLIIPPPLWHGTATLGDAECGLVYYVTRAYDHQSPDEDRRPRDSVEGFVWNPEHD